VTETADQANETLTQSDSRWNSSLMLLQQWQKRKPDSCHMGTAKHITGWEDLYINVSVTDSPTRIVTHKGHRG